MHVQPPPGQGITPGTVDRRLQVFGCEAFAALIETRRSEKPAGEIIVIDVEIERPQSLVHDIRRLERIAVVFRVEDHHQPEILALRADFPLVPHVFVAEQEVPRRLCIYDQPFENEKPAREIRVDDNVLAAHLKKKT